ncbi:MAG TPA: PHP domain-containing protein, partial [Polyangiaceae bacterium]|nr:PHP domain-containing protein [Polyangiaceae bacterium]
MPFAELAAKSNFSFLEGASHPEELVERAGELGLSAIGIADREGIYGLVRAYRAAKERDVHLVAGAELTIEYPGLALGERGRGDAPPAVILLVRDADGYASLCNLVTAAHAHHEKGSAGLLPETLAAGARGLELVIPIDRPALEAAALDPAGWGEAWASALEALRGRVHVATYRRLDGLDDERNLRAEALARGLGCEVFASSRPLFHHASKKPLADVV